MKPHDLNSHTADAMRYVAGPKYQTSRPLKTRKLFKIDTVALLFRPGSLWVGAHWSPNMRQWCINLVPCVTIRVRLK